MNVTQLPNTTHLLKTQGLKLFFIDWFGMEWPLYIYRIFKTWDPNFWRRTTFFCPWSMIVVVRVTRELTVTYKCKLSRKVWTGSS